MALNGNLFLFFHPRKTNRGVEFRYLIRIVSNSGGKQRMECLDTGISLPTLLCGIKSDVEKNVYFEFIYFCLNNIFSNFFFVVSYKQQPTVYKKCFGLESVTTALTTLTIRHALQRL